jgi:hypothetical protein
VSVRIKRYNTGTGTYQCYEYRYNWNSGSDPDPGPKIRNKRRNFIFEELSLVLKPSPRARPNVSLSGFMEKLMAFFIYKFFAQ